MAQALCFWLDLYYPRAYVGALAEDVVYLSVQPLLAPDPSRATQGAPPPALSPTLRAYFGMKPADLGDLDLKVARNEDPAVRLIGQQIQAEVGAGNADYNWTPVPLPPGTTVTMRFAVQGSPVQRVITRTIGDDNPPFGLSPARWVDVVAQNGYRVPVFLLGEDWTWAGTGEPRLDAAQRGEMLAWAVDLLRDVLPSGVVMDKWTDLQKALHPLLQPEFAALPQDAQNISEFLDADKTGSPGVPRKFFAFRQALVQLQMDRRQSEASRMTAVPRFEYTAQALTDALPEDLRLLFPPESNSYAERTWQQFMGQLGYPGAPVHRSAEDHVASALRRLFGFGERMKWPRDAAIAADMMLWTRDDTPEAPAPDGWQWTNAQSLAGLVFGVKIHDLSNLDLVAIEVGGRPVSLESLPTINADIDSFVDAARQATPARFELDVALAPAPRIGNVVFQPKLSMCSELRGGPGAPQRLAVPASVLDALEGAPAFGMPLTSPLANARLLAVTPQRVVVAPAELLGWPEAIPVALRVRVRARRFAMTGGDEAVAAFHIRVNEPDLEPGDRIAVAARIRDAAAGASITLLLEAATHGGPIREVTAAGSALRAAWQPDNPAGTDDLALLVSGRTSDEPIKSLIEWQAGLGRGKDAPGEADLIVSAGAGERFNVVLTSEKNAVLALAHYFDLLFGRSTDRLRQSFELTYRVQAASGSAGWVDLTGDFRNFQKVWVWLRADATDERRLTMFDHLLPVTKGRYDLRHEFSSPTVSRQEVGKDRVRAESDRYALCRHAGKPWEFVIRADHPYGHRVTAKSRPLLTLPIISPVSHPASLTAGRKKVGAAAEEAQVFPMLTFDVQEVGTEEKVQFTLHSDFFAQILRPRRDADTVSAADSIDEPDREQLRRLYECAMDMDARLGNRVTLYIERWELDCCADEVAPTAMDIGAGNQYPSLVPAMRLTERRVRTLDGAVAELFLPLVELGRAADYGAFLIAVQHLASGLDLRLDIPLDERWLSELPGKASGKPFLSASDLVRVGLRIERASDRVPPPGTCPTVDDMSPLLPQRETFQGAIGLPSDAQLRAAGAEAAVAAHDLLNIQPSIVREAFAWLLVRKGANEGPETRSSEQADNIRALLGAAAPVCLVPPRTRSAGAAPVRLYTVPIAFLPLAPLPALNDQASTYALAVYLLSLTQGLCTGESLEPVLSVHLTDSEALNCCLRAQRLRMATAARIAHILLAIVEDDEPGGELRSWEGYTPFGSTTNCDTNALQGQLDLLRKVRGLREPTFDVDGSPVRRAVGSLLARDLRLFGATRAFAVHLFDPSSVEPRLFSVMVGKRIRDADAGGTVKNDADRFPFTRFVGAGRNRFLLDLLDDASYDSEFEIPPEWVLGRTSEDVLENRCPYPDELNDATNGSGRSVQVEVVHHNPEWRAFEEGTCTVNHHYYVLPSRLPPTTPKPVRVVVASETPPALRSQSIVPVHALARQGETDEDLRRAFHDPESPRGVDTWGIDVASGGLALSGFDRVRSLDFSKPSMLYDPDEPRHEGWHQLDTYLAHHHFQISGDHGGGLEGFRNDTFRIEIEELPLAPSPQVAPASASTVAPLDGPAARLLEWYAFERGRDAGHLPSPAPDAFTSAEDLLSGLETLLGDGASSMLQPAVAEAEDEADGAPSRVTRYRPPSEPGKPGRLVVAKSDAPSATMGHVIDCRILSAQAAGVGGAPPADVNVLRFTLLCSAWRRYRARVRVIRNARDVDHDGDADMNSRFVMHSDFSPWSDLGDFVVRRSPAELPKHVQQWVPAAGLTAAQWQQMDGATQVNLGRVTDSLAAATASPRLLAPDARSSENWVQVDSETHFIDTSPTSPGTVRRETSTPRSGSDRRVPADQDALIFQFRKGVLDSTALRLRVAWLANSGSTVLVVDRWPVRWND